MGQNKKNFKLAAVLLVFGLLAFSFAGCGSKNSNNSTSGNRRGFNQAEMKQRYSDELKKLVSSGTINQTQSDKILAALTTGRQGGFNRKQNGGQGNSTQSGNQSSSQNNGQSSSRQRFNPLSKLVQDGTITQQQADTVWQNLRGNRKSNSSGNTDNSNTTQQ